MGRPKGSFSVRCYGRALALSDKLNELKFDAVEKFVEAFDEIADPYERAQASLAIMSFVYPRLKSVTHSIEDKPTGANDVHLERLKLLLDDPIPEIQMPVVCESKSIAIK